MSSLPPPYPLLWPSDWQPTARAARARSPYRATFTRSRDQVVGLLRKMSSGFVITSNVPTGARGLPSTDYREPVEPGVAVYWVVRGSVRVLACDAWASVRENMRAIGHALEALRTLEHAKASQILARAMQGFTAPALSSPRPAWYGELRLATWPPSAADIKAAYGRRALEVHPDHGGTSEAFHRLTQARDLAIAFVGLHQGAAP